MLNSAHTFFVLLNILIAPDKFKGTLTASAAAEAMATGWRRAREIDPTRLFRSLGVGASVITPFGPLGLDYAYGLDRLDINGRRAPKWQLHFRFGQIF